MGGYVIAAVMIGPIKGTDVCYGILCWRWPLLVEWFMLVPFCIAIHFVPTSHLIMRIGKEADNPASEKQIVSESDHPNFEEPSPSDPLYLSLENGPKEDLATILMSPQEQKMNLFAVATEPPHNRTVRFPPLSPHINLVL